MGNHPLSPKNGFPVLRIMTMTATVPTEDALVLRQDEAGVATLTLNRP